MTVIREIPIIDLPRSKLISRGAESLELSELVAAIIGHGSSFADCLKTGKMVASVLMEKLYDTHPRDLWSIPGVGEAKACQIVAALELARRFAPPKLRRAIITKPSDVLPFVTSYRFEMQEHLLVLSLTGAHEVINIRCVTKGILDNCQVHPREVFADAISDRAAAIICVHNHPSGRLEASKNDIKFTHDMKECGRLLGIPVLDSLIIGPEDGYTSIPEE